MKFYVINKPKGSYSVEAKDIKEASTKTTSNPFMIVAADYVKDGEIYQAIQTKPDTVLLNKKPGHEFVSAATISEALRMPITESENTNTDEEPKYNVVTVYNGDEVITTRSFDVTNGDVIIDSFIDRLSEPTKEGYTFKGWAFSKTAKYPTERPIKALASKETTSIYAVFEENPVINKETENNE